MARFADSADIDAMITAAKGVRANLENGPAAIQAANAIATSARGFLASHDGTRLAALDPLIAGEVDAFDDDEEDLLDEAIAIAEGDAAGGGEPDVSGADAGATSATATTSAATSSGARTSTVVAAIPAEGEKRQHIRPRSSHDTLPASACQKCHGEENAWWFENRHFSSIDPFLERQATASRIARLYGISPSKMARGDSLCMDCHGTVATGRERREVQDGVSCQSCHGPGADFLEPHQDETNGRQQALGLGMRDLSDLETRVRNCASCHYVTDPRLISSGHPSGADFNLAAGMLEVRHWSAPLAPAGQLASVWKSVQAARGPVPRVRQARLASRSDASTAPSSGASHSARRQSPADQLAALGGANRASAAVGQRPRPSALSAERGRSERFRETAGSTLELPPLPEIDASDPVEDVLILIKQRLELLHRAVATGSVDAVSGAADAATGGDP